MPLDNHPQIFDCLGMVVGLYGHAFIWKWRVFPNEAGYLRGRTAGKSSRADWLGSFDLERTVAGGYDRVVVHERFIGGSRFPFICTMRGLSFGSIWGDEELTLLFPS